MNHRRTLAIVALAFTVAPALAQIKEPRVNVGKREFESNCASCHGMNGKGNGPSTPYLTKSPPDLTTLSRRNGGNFPFERLYGVIEGGTVQAHGSRDMPIWGRDYRIQAGEYYMDVPYDPEVYVRGKILSLLEHLNQLQTK